MKSDTSSITKTRRRYDAEFKRRLVRMSLAPGASAAKIALEHQLNANLLFKWRRLYLREMLAASGEAVKLLPVTVNGGGEVSRKPAVQTARGGRARGRMRSDAIEIELAEGRIRVNSAIDIEWLRAVVRLVRDR